jgi:hypothetical protein
MPNMENTLVRGFLQNASVSYRNGAYINQEIFPLLDMPSPKTKIHKYNLGDTFRNTAKLRSRGAAVNVQDFDITEVNQDTKQYDQASKITKEDMRDAGLEPGTVPPMNLQQDSVEFNADKIDLGREIRVATHIKAATWADGNAGGEDVAGLWNASESGNTFFTDIETAVQALKVRGVPDMANMRLAMDWKTFWQLNQVTAIREVLKYTSQDRLSPEKLAQYLGLSKIVVGSAIYNTAAKVKGSTTDMTGAYIWDVTGNKGWAFVYYYPPRISLKMLAAGLQPRSKMDTGLFRSTYSWYENKEHSWYFDTQEETGIETIYTGAGYQFTDTHTT